MTDITADSIADMLEQMEDTADSAFDELDAPKPKQSGKKGDWRKLYGRFISSGELKQVTKRISTGSFSLDVAMQGGLPMGVVTRIWGEEMSGKTTLCMRLAANALDQGYRVLWIDAEESLIRHIAERNGLDVDRVDVIASVDDILTYDDTIAIITNYLAEMKKTGQHALIIIDSLDRLPTKDELKADVTDRKIASASTITTRWLKTGIVPMLRWTQSGLVFIQQVRANIGGRYVLQKPSGGYALAHEAKLRIFLKPYKQLTVSKQKVGNQIQWIIEKSKNSFLPGLTGSYPLRYDHNIGIDRASEILQIGQTAKIVIRAGSTYKWFGYDGEEVKIVGTQPLRDMMIDAPEIVAYLEARIMESLGVDAFAYDEEEEPLPMEETEE